ncbi:MAG: hypothetical protein M1324_02620 [Patescibacteria group bacterium]|nr:hypothetical protein [Patescibacteria group bacterium]
MAPILLATITGQDLVGIINVSTTPLGVTGLVTLIITWLLYFAGVLAFIFLVVSGIMYITAGGNPEQSKKAQQGLINAVIGIIIISLAFAILRAVGSFTTIGV